MNIVHLTQTNSAYVPATLVHLVNRYTNHRAYLLQAKNFIFGNPMGVNTPRDAAKIIDILDKADILHFHGNAVFDRRKFLGIKIREYYRKPFVLHYHGTPQRERHFRYRRAVPMLVSTPEMLPLFPGSRYFPNLIDEKHELFANNQRRRVEGRTPRICHHFSFHRHLKNTNRFDRACMTISNNGRCVDFGYILRLPLEEAIAERANYDVVFDHLQGYYGLISIESMAQGLMVINGMDLSVKRQVEAFFGAVPPFFVTNKNDFVDDLNRITPTMIDEYGTAGKEFIRDYWSGEVNIGRLIEIYEKL